MGPPEKSRVEIKFGTNLHGPGLRFGSLAGHFATQICICIMHHVINVCGRDAGDVWGQRHDDRDSFQTPGPSTIAPRDEVTACGGTPHSDNHGYWDMV